MAKDKHDDHEKHDQLFMVNFGKVMAGLGAIFAVCIIAAVMIVNRAPIRDDAEVTAQIAARLQPVARVVTDPSQLVKVAAVKREPYTGEQVVQRVCAGCHTAGVLGAPKTGDAADWGARFGQGLDVLVQHSIEGIRTMPARGGDPDLSDDEIRESVKVLLQQSGIRL